MTTTGLSFRTETGRAFFNLMWGQLCSRFGWSMTTFILPLLIFDMTHSVTVAGLMSAASLAAGIISLAPIGVVVDAVSRVALMRIAYASLLILTVLAVVLLHVHADAAVLIGVAALGTIANVLSGPALIAIMRQIVPKEVLGRAFSIEQGRSRVVGLLGAPVGGVLYTAGHAAPLVACAMLQAIAVLSSLSLRANQAGRGANLRRFSDWTGGLTFLRSRRDLYSIAALGCLLNFCLYGTLTAIVLGLRSRSVSASKLSLIELCTALGGLAIVPVSSWVTDRVNLSRIALLCSIAISASFLAIGLFPVLVVACAALFVCAGALTPWNAAMFGYITVVTGRSLQGRVQAAISIASGCISPLAPVASTALLRVSGLGTTCLIFAILSLATVGVQLSPHLAYIGLLRDYVSGD